MRVIGDFQFSRVYMITCIVNERTYIGRSDMMEIRIKEHRRTLKAGKHHNTPLQADFNLYGMEAFTIEGIAKGRGLDEFNGRDLELECIDKYKPYYNLEMYRLWADRRKAKKEASL